MTLLIDHFPLVEPISKRKKMLRKLNILIL
uniref:Uncharacterized protein n=1 Tax=Arundo donax TaxID=35708 RepID=A0A0A9ABT5_ARUDO